MSTLQEILPQLPPDIQREVRDFAEFLMKKRQPHTDKTPRLQWRGRLRHLRAQYSSVQLQHQVLQSWSK